MTDKQKIDMWNEICTKKGWSKKYELEAWLLSSGVRFTHHGSVVPPDHVVLNNQYNNQLQVRGVSGEMLATIILQCLSGIITFSSYKIETLFYNEVVERLKIQFNVDFPKELLPKQISQITPEIKEDNHPLSTTL